MQIFVAFDLFDFSLISVALSTCFGNWLSVVQISILPHARRSGRLGDFNNFIYGHSKNLRYFLFAEFLCVCVLKTFWARFRKNPQQQFGSSLRHTVHLQYVLWLLHFIQIFN